MGTSRGNGRASFWAEGAQPLDEREQERVAAALAAGESVVAFIRGRTDGRRAVWVATGSRVARVGTSWFGRTEATAYGEIQAIEAHEGAHGHTVRLMTARATHHLVAVNPAASEAFTAHLAGATGLAPRFVASIRRLREEAEAARRAEEARAREARLAAAAQSAVPRAPTDLVQALAEAARLREAGTLSDEEFQRLKQRLLEG